MRIRLRVPKDGNEIHGGGGDRPASRWFLGWIERQFGSPKPTTSPATLPLPKPDRRWHACHNARYLFIGRHCRYFHGRWQSEYVFDIRVGTEMQTLRITLPEPMMSEWEAQNGRRVSEELRLGLAIKTMEALIGHDRLPAATTVAHDAVATLPVTIS